MTRPALLPGLLLLAAACPTVDDDLPGYLCQVTVEAIQDTCSPQRFVGDGGVQWLGIRDDGGLAFSVLDQVKYGPTRGGEALAGVTRETLPPFDGGMAQFGADDACRALVGGWVALDGGLQLNQQWPGIDNCPSAPAYVPNKACVAVRFLRFEPIGECPQRCVVLTNVGASCDC
ncbi:MAG: hypothetical protein AB1938_00345 [Myxococcota bacterium]